MIRFSYDGQQTKLRWYHSLPVLVAVTLLVWPVGVCLIISRYASQKTPAFSVKAKRSLSVPYQARKTREEKTAYLITAARRKKVRVTAVILTAIFLGIGFSAITYDYLILFCKKHISTVWASEFFSHCLFLLVGLYVCFQTASMFRRHHLTQVILECLNEKESEDLVVLSREVSLAPSVLTEMLCWMIKEYFFGTGAAIEEERGRLVCYKAPETQ